MTLRRLLTADPIHPQLEGFCREAKTQNRYVCTVVLSRDDFDRFWREQKLAQATVRLDAAAPEPPPPGVMMVEAIWDHRVQPGNVELDLSGEIPASPDPEDY